MAVVFSKLISLLQKKLPWKQDNSWNKKIFLQTYNTWTNTIHSWWNEASPLFSCKTCSLKERIPLLKNDVYFVLLFQLYVRYTADMQPYLFPKKIYVFFISFCIIAECFNQLIHNLVKVHRKLCTYRHQHICLGKPFSFRIGTQRIPFWHIAVLLPLLL